MHHLTLRTALLGGTALMLACPAAPALAQTNVAPAQSALTQSAPTAPDYGDNDIIVTAQKREQRLNDVGLTVTAVGSQVLEERNITTLADIAQIVPGLVFSTSASNTPVYTLRGVGFNDTTLGSHPDVSVYLDEAPLPFPVIALTSRAAADTVNEYVDWSLAHA